MKSHPRNAFERQIYEEVERETCRSRYRQRISGRYGTIGRIVVGKRVHPVQHDVNQLAAFLISRRLRQPGTLDLARRIQRSVDTEALRLATALVLEKGSYTPAMRRRCERIEGYCDVFEAALTLLIDARDYLVTEPTGETAMIQQSELETALVKVLDEYGDPDATAEVVQKASSLPHDDNWISAAAAFAGEVWRRKLARATVRAEKANRDADAQDAANKRPPSDTLH